MALVQALRQQHFIEKGAAPTSSRQVQGLSGTSEGVPRMHSLFKSPVMKAASLMHGLKIKKFKMTTPKLRMPSLKLKMPRV